MGLPNLVQVAFVAPFGDAALVIQHDKEAMGLQFHHIQHVLVIHEHHLLVGDALRFIALNL